MKNDLIYLIPSENHSKEVLLETLSSHPEIKFVSLIGVDLSGNDTDEKIPIKLFIEDIDTFLHGAAAQTDGSSVAFPGIATLNNAKVDMIVDLKCNWFVDYNYEHIDPLTNKPIGTLRIPCFLYHDNKAVDSRNILNNSIEHFKSTILSLLKKYPETLSQFGIQFDDIQDIIATSATELEFWVKTPNDNAEIEELSTSEVLQEQYWTRTKGCVRTALEQSIMLMESYGLEPEMGHKEVGGVKAKLTDDGSLTHIMEQLEVDWKFSTAVQCADNELLVRTLIKETFRRNGLDVTFLAKPIDDVAGSGKHIHVGIALKLKNGKKLNLFSAPNNHFISNIGYGALMGILKNYEIMNPFISSTNDSLKRLKPGFEAPICTVTSLGVDTSIPSRNRTVLVGLIRDLQNPLATRFELRSPNPHTNTYLALAVTYMSMADGVNYAIQSKKSNDELLSELSKKPGDYSDYLEKGRCYRSEEDVFEYYSEAERSEFFGVAPATVYENLKNLELYKSKLEVLKVNNVLDDSLINSFKLATINRWVTEIKHRLINNYIDEIRSLKQLHSNDKALDLDISTWMSINELRYYIMKDTYSTKSLFTRIQDCITNKDYNNLSLLQIELEDKMIALRHLYSNYKKNLLDI
ncbi:glutamine synthetase [Clostridium frigidicarnis]|uniref:glutamine synthetase n=1 Tax=Clostridium frigidicarnis TaxID=84698 RepID=A0A1I0YQV7_9CLOT|nr:glutamine synthetase [Clostridium frigidicarnis]SFB15592.1 L-glutamine synthetase [Clostridium frigidicarnis]